MTLYVVQTELKDLEQELALRQNTGRDLVTQLLGEKDARKEVPDLASILSSHMP